MNTFKIGIIDLPSPGQSAMNLVAADVSPLMLSAGEIRADSRRLLRFAVGVSRTLVESI